MNPRRPRRTPSVRRYLLSTGLALLIAGPLATSPATVVPAAAISPHVPFRLMEASIRETQAALRAGTVTSEELVTMYLQRIAAYDKQGPAINAVIRINPNAVAEARALDAERRSRKGLRGPLHGIPYLLKDNYDTFDMPTTAASLSLATSVPPDDAFQVRRLRAAGAIIVAKVNLSEFARVLTTFSSLGGQTLNPYALDRNPGGSSGGTGAAVAANFGAFGLGTDTCGSIRIPSSHNSLVGMRATQGLFSLDGIVPLAHSQDVGGPMARSVEDVAIVLDAIAGFDPNDPSTAASELHTPASYTHALRRGRLRHARLGLLSNVLVVDPADQEVANVVLGAKARLQQLGATVLDVSIPNYADISRTSLITFEFKFDLERYLADTPLAPFKTLDAITNSGLIDPFLISRFQASVAIPSLDTPEYRAAVAMRETFRNAVLKVMTDNDLDALIYPTMRQKPVLVPEKTQPGSNCAVSAQTGLPAISVPAGFTPDGVPVGMEFLGRQYAEEDLLRLAYSWEQATHIRRPPPTTPTIEPTWTWRVTDGVSTALFAPAGKHFRFTAPDMDTDVYIDPDMRTKKGVVTGAFRDDRWHVSYLIVAGGQGVSTIIVTNRRSGETTTLYGTATAP